ncbi:phosphatidylinositol transfer protein [Besnoitia besnoiti]|uniref:Phosphatidylinositol transfer protein n=1 Tax=Besnoitia besnoiti TaxID=94643 RepID=A0A2A9M290_BESBE|nr:phosphatidylinositol transfer protein [Besnoitia besnoiti]PFH32105.1 phosphatidylinositol transfer protein [Besnoitia besnoiti]
MKVYEYRLVLPMTPEQYRRCQLYMVAKASLEDAAKATAEGAANDCMQILKNEEYLGEDGSTGQYTHKRINIANKLPGWLVSWVDTRLTVFDEKSWNAFPRLKTTYDCELFSKAKVSMISHHLDGVQTDDNALDLDAAMLAQRKVVLIDIVNDPVAPKAYVAAEDPARFHSTKAGIGPLTKDWMTHIPLVPDESPPPAPETNGAAYYSSAVAEAQANGGEGGEQPRMRRQYPIMTCYKLFVLDFPYFGFMASKVENWITGAMRDVLLSYHRKAVCWMDEWYDLSMEGIRRMEDEVKEKLDAIRGEAAPALPPSAPSPPEKEDAGLQDGRGAGASEAGEAWSPTSDQEEIEDDRAEGEHSGSLSASLPFSVSVDALAPWSLDAPDVYSLSAVAKASRGAEGDQNLPSCPPTSGRPAAGTTAAGVASALAGAPEAPKDLALHSGFLFKLGDGLWNTTWNLRYVVLRGSKLQYFNDPRDARAKHLVDLEGAQISWTGELRQRTHSFLVHPVGRRAMHFSGETLEASRQWLVWLRTAAQSAGLHEADRRRFSSLSCSHHFHPKSLSASPSRPSGGTSPRHAPTVLSRPLYSPATPFAEACAAAAERTGGGDGEAAEPPGKPAHEGEESRLSGDPRPVSRGQTGETRGDEARASAESRTPRGSISRGAASGSRAGAGAGGDGEVYSELLFSPQATPELEYCVRRLRFLLSSRMRPRFTLSRHEDDIRVCVKDSSQWISIPPPKAVHIQDARLSRQASSAREAPAAATAGAAEAPPPSSPLADGEREPGRRAEKRRRLDRAWEVLCLVLPIFLPLFAIYQFVVLLLQGIAFLSSLSSGFIFFLSRLSSLSPLSSSLSSVVLSSLASSVFPGGDAEALEGFSLFLAIPSLGLRLVKNALLGVLLFALRVLLWILLPLFLGRKLLSYSRLFNPAPPQAPRRPSPQSQAASAVSLSPSARQSSSSAPANQEGGRGGVEAPLSSAAGRDLVVKANCVVNATAEELFLLLMDVELMGAWMLGHRASPRVWSESIHSDVLSLSFSPSLLLASSPAATAEAFLAACSPYMRPTASWSPRGARRGGLAERPSLAMSAARAGTLSPFEFLQGADVATFLAASAAALAGPLLPPLLRERRMTWRRFWGQTRDGSFVIVLHSDRQLEAAGSGARAAARRANLEQDAFLHCCRASGEPPRGGSDRHGGRRRVREAGEGPVRGVASASERPEGALKQALRKLLLWGRTFAGRLASAGGGLSPAEPRREGSRLLVSLLQTLLRLLRMAFPVALHPFSVVARPSAQTSRVCEAVELAGGCGSGDAREDVVRVSGFEAFIITPLSPSLNQRTTQADAADARGAPSDGGAPPVGLQSPEAAVGTAPCLLTFVSAVDWGGEMPRWLRERISLLRADRILRGAKMEGELRRAGTGRSASEDFVATDSMETSSEAGSDADAEEGNISGSAREREALPAPHGSEEDEAESEEQGGAARKPGRAPNRVPLALLRGFRRAPEGGLMVSNQALIDQQKSVFLDLVRCDGEAVLEGRSLASVSLPVRVLEPTSLLPHLASCWGHAPLFLARAASATDALERFKWTMTFAIASLHFGCCRQKPFNPLLGESYQGGWRDGSKVFLEQTACDPPTTSFIVRGPKRLFSFWGCYAFKAQLKGNYGVLTQEGETVVVFPETKTEIRYCQPAAKVSGLLWGHRVFEWGGKMEFRDEENRLACRVQFGVSGEKAAQSTWPCVASDLIFGEIKDIATGKTCSTMTGSWIDKILFDGKSYWNGYTAPAPLEDCPDSQALPTDSRFRPDVLCLREGRVQQAQEWKLELEAVQRRDRAVRANALALRQTAGLVASA